MRIAGPLAAAVLLLLFRCVALSQAPRAITSESNTVNLEDGFEPLDARYDRLPIDSLLTGRYDAHFSSGLAYDPRRGGWVRLTIRTRLHPGTRWLLETDLMSLKDAYQCYGRRVHHQRNGMEIPLRDRAVVNDPAALNIVLTDTVTTVYMYCAPDPDAQKRPGPAVSARLIPYEDYRKNLHERQLVWMLFLGIMLAVVVTNFFFFIAGRERSHVYYIGYVLFASLYLYELHIMQIVAPWLTGNDVVKLAQVINPLFILFYHGFVRASFRDIIADTRWRVLYRALGWAVVAVLLLSIALPVTHLAGVFSTYAILTVNVLVMFASLGVSVTAFAHRRPASLPFLLAIVPLVTAELFLVLRLMLAGMGVSIPNYFGLQYGVLAQVVLFSYALASRFHLAHRELLRQEMENDALIKLNDMKTKLFAVISHDLRSPLATLAMTVDAVEHGLLDETLQRDLIGNVRVSLESINEMLSNLLLWSDRQMRDSAPHVVPINLRDLADRTVHVFHESLRRKGVSLRLDVPDRAFCLADADQIAVVIRNLLSNAIKFSRNDDEITFTAAPSGAYWTVSVRDTGTGIPAEIRAKLFDARERTTTRGTQNEKGSGLGLLLCKDFIELNGGTIRVDSEPGKGAMFSFTVPAMPESDAAALPAP
jgi:signal transduction histidine kinase